MPSEPTGQRDESVQFSLQELTKLEDERLAEQKRAAAEREATATRQRGEEERSRREEAETHARQEAERRENAERRALEDIARREALQKAVVEQGRLEVEVRARAEERERERRHEIEIERLRNEGRQGQSMGSLAGAAALGGGIMLAVTLAVVLGVTKPAADRRIAELESEVAAAGTRTGDLTRQLEDQRRALEGRERQLADALRANDASGTKGSTGPSNPGPPTSGSKPPPTPPGRQAPPEPVCLKGDPMCFAVERNRR